MNAKLSVKKTHKQINDTMFQQFNNSTNQQINNSTIQQILNRFKSRSKMSKDRSFIYYFVTI
jgi:hypothetical protein